MSEAAPVRERVNPRRGGPPAHRLHKSNWPWFDRSGRFSPLKLATLLLTLGPAVWVTYGFAAHQLGPKPVTEAIHQTGLWAIRFLVLSLLVSPLRTIFNWHRVALLRRMLGLAALFYALGHLALYATDQNWRLHTVASELLLRFYLEVGLVALVGLAVLGVTSTDAVLRRLGHRWKQLHRIVYGLAVLAAFHFFLQTKADAGEATLMAGLLLWLLGWRLVPAGPDRHTVPLVGLTLAAALATVGVEAAWYGLGTNVAVVKPLRAELVVEYGPHPAVQVLILGLCLCVAAGLHHIRHRTKWHETVAFDIALYGGGAVIAAALVFTFSLADDWLPDDWVFWHAAGGFVAVAALAGVVRWLLPRGRLVLDAVWVVCLVALLLVGIAV